MTDERRARVPAPGDAGVRRTGQRRDRSGRGATGSLWDHYDVALAVARAKYPGLSDEDHVDIVQEAMTNVPARLRRGPIADERSYLLRVVYTVGAHVLRERTRPTLSLDVVDGGDAVEAQVDRASAPVNPEEQMLRDAEVSRLRAIIETELTEDEAAALLMRTVDRMTPADIAEAMGWSPRRYRKLLERGNRKLNAGWSASAAASCSCCTRRGRRASVSARRPRRCWRPRTARGYSPPSVDGLIRRRDRRRVALRRSSGGTRDACGVWLRGLARADGPSPSPASNSSSCTGSYHYNLFARLSHGLPTIDGAPSPAPAVDHDGRWSTATPLRQRTR